MSDVNSKLDTIDEARNGQSDVIGHPSLENQERREKLRGLMQDIDERKTYAGRTFRFLCAYMAVVFLMLAACGIDCVPFHFSDAVVIALITTTTANVIGIFLFVMRYLFNGKA